MHVIQSLECASAAQAIVGINFRKLNTPTFDNRQKDGNISGFWFQMV